MKNVITEFKKIFTGYGFWLCVAFTTILCFSAEIYQDSLTGNRYSVIRALLSFDRETMLQYTDFCSLEVMRKGSWGWINLFIPIVSAFAFVPLECDEHEAKVVRYEVFRSSRIKFHLSEIISAVISGGLAVSIGYAIYALLVYFLFPGINAFDQENVEMYKEMTQYMNIPDNYAVAALQKTACVFLYGVTMSAPVIMLSGLIRNKYLVLCIPFFIKYVINQTCQKVSAQMYSGGENVDQRLSDFISIINPDSAASLNEYGNLSKYILMYSLAVIAGCFVLYLVFSMRRVDCGE